MLSKLDAVNECLDALGEDPVSSLSSGLDDAAKAERVLDKVTKQVLAKGWHCNRDVELSFSPDVNGNIAVASNVLRIDASGQDKGTNVTIRAREDGNPYLYKVRDQTFVFDKKLMVDVIWDFDFEDLTAELQMYIAAKAAREYQESEMGSVNLDSFQRRRESEAWAALQDAEAESEDSNILDESPHCYWITHRQTYNFR